MGRTFPVVTELIRGRGPLVGHPSVGLPPASVQKTQPLLNKRLECVLSHVQGCACSTLAPDSLKHIQFPVFHNDNWLHSTPFTIYLLIPDLR